MNYQPTASAMIDAIRRAFIAARLEQARKDAQERQGVAQQAAAARVAYWERQQGH